MGTRVDRSGITVQLYDDAGEPSGKPYFGKFAEFRGRAQSAVTKSAPLKGDEVDLPGSADWLTLVAVADTQERLTDILRTTTVGAEKANTSGASRRVQIDIHVGDSRLSLGGRIAIASGPIVTIDPPVMNVVHFKVLAEGDRLRDGHPLLEDFKGMGPFFR